MIQRIFMLIVFIVGLFLSFAGYVQFRASLLLNYPDFFNTERSQATVTEPGRCHDSADGVSQNKPAIRELSQIFKVKLNASSEVVQIIARDCHSFVIGDQVEILNEGLSLRGKKMWSLKRDKLSWLDLIGPILFVFGIMAIYFGLKRVFFGFPKPISPAK